MPYRNHQLSYPIQLSIPVEGQRHYRINNAGWLRATNKPGKRRWLYVKFEHNEQTFLIYFNATVIKEMIRFLERDPQTGDKKQLQRLSKKQKKLLFGLIRDHRDENYIYEDWADELREHKGVPTDAP